MTAKITASADGTYGSLGVGANEAFRFGADNSGQLASFRNKLINGGFDIAQLGATYNLAAALGYGLDRFFAGQNTAANGRFAQLTYNGNGFSKIALLGRNGGATQVGVIYAGQVIESANAVSLQGKKVTLSFFAYAGANFSAAGGLLSVYIKSGTGVDEGAASMLAGTWTGNASPLNITQQITATRTKYSFTADIPANAKEVGFYIAYTPVGTAGADDNIYFHGVQLEEGSIATPFEQRPIGLELSLCQRYYEAGAITLGGYLPNTTDTIRSYGQFKVTKRAGAAIVLVTPISDASNLANGTFVVAGSDARGFSYFGSSGGAGALYGTQGWTASAEL